MLAKLGIQVDRKYIQALLRAIDVNGNGLIEFEEFATLVIYDPYKWVNEYFVIELLFEEIKKLFKL